MRKTLHSREVRGSTRACCEASNLHPGTTNTGRIKELAEVARPGLRRGGNRGAGFPDVSTCGVCLYQSVNLCVDLDMMKWVCVCSCGVFVSFSTGAAEGEPESMCAVCCWPHVPSSHRGQAVLWAELPWPRHSLRASHLWWSQLLLEAQR